MSDRLQGARIVHVEALTEPLRWVLVFEHRGTDDGSGYLIVDGSDIHFNDGGDPDAWRELSLASKEPCPDCGCPGELYDGHVCEDFAASQPGSGA